MAVKQQKSQEEIFVEKLGNQIITLIRSTDDLSKKKELFRGLLVQNFNMKSIGKFVLSRHWRAATDQQKEQFAKLFEQNMVDTYTSQFDQYKDEKMIVQNSRRDKKDGAVWVSTTVQGSAREPINIRWKLYNKDNQLKVYDIHVNEVSMCITHRSEYASIIDQNGGNINGLILVLQNNTRNRRQ